MPEVFKTIFVILHYYKMLRIVYPEFPFKIKKDKGKEMIFDEVRKKWVTLSPEEWVRQNFLQYLITQKKYPAGLISVEKKLVANEQTRRYDIVVYKNSKPWMIVECKEPETKYDEKTVWQILNYNTSLAVPYLVITNGNESRCFYLANGTAEEINELPDY